MLVVAREESSHVLVSKSEFCNPRAVTMLLLFYSLTRCKWLICKEPTQIDTRRPQFEAEDTLIYFQAKYNLYSTCLLYTEEDNESLCVL